MWTFLPDSCQDRFHQQCWLLNSKGAYFACRLMGYLEWKMCGTFTNEERAQARFVILKQLFEWALFLRMKWGIIEELMLCKSSLQVWHLSLCLSVSVFQVSFICVWVFTACRRTEISTDLPFRGKTFFHFGLLCLHGECGSTCLEWPEMKHYCSGFNQLISF